MGGEGYGWLVIVAGATNPQKKRKKAKQQNSLSGKPKQQKELYNPIASN